MKKMLNPKEYDFYQLLIPVSNMFGRKRENYIYKELEKRHPCFSDNFAYEYSSKLTRKGVLCGVTVIDKNILGMYRNKYPKATLYTKEKQLIWQNRKKIGFCIFVFVFAVIIISIFSVIKMVPVSRGNETPQIQEKITEPEKNYFSLSESMLTDIAECNGKIKSFQWMFDGFSERSVLLLSDCFPSDFEYSSEKASLIFSPVIFQKGISEFSVTAENRVCSLNFPNEKNIGNRKKIFEELNHWLLENQMTIVNEDYLSGKIKVLYIEPKENLFFEFGKKLDLLYEKYGFSLNELKIEKNNIELGFTEDFPVPFEKNIFHCLSEINPYFYEEKENVTIKKTDLPKTGITETRKKIGAIIHENGEKKTFYINAKGKIENEER